MNFGYIIGELLEGLGRTLLLFVITLVGSLPLGMLLAAGARSRIKPLVAAIRALVWVIRGTPLMLQILLVSFLPKYLFGMMNKQLTDLLHCTTAQLLFSFVCIAFIINYACYFCEIFRGALDSVPKGQYEAAAVLGMTKIQTFFRVILLQVVKRAIAPVSNEIITLVKDTALAQILGVVDLLSAATHAVNTYVVLSPLVYAAVFYLIFNGVLTVVFSRVEKKLAFYRE